MKQTTETIVRVVVLIALLVAAFGIPSGTASAAFQIPYGATITSARMTLNYWFEYFPDMPINVHRVTAPWQEMTVTWSSMQGNFDPAVLTTFTTGHDDNQLVTVDILPLVQGWYNGTIANNGLLLKAPVSDNSYNVFFGREGPVPPTLEICFRPVGADSDTCVKDVAVADASLWETSPNDNFGAVNSLYVGRVNGITKYSVIQFELQVSPPPPGNPGTGTPGFWKNHPEAWPVDSIVIGGISYTKEEAIAYLTKDNSEDKTITMFRALVAAKLNVEIGNDSSCIAGTIAQADAWMAANGPVGSKLPASSDAWKTGEPLATTLDNYNNGYLCAPARD